MPASYLADSNHVMDVNDAMIERLHRVGLAYPCNDCDCCNSWHLVPGVAWEDIDLGMVQIQMEEPE